LAEPFSVAAGVHPLPFLLRFRDIFPWRLHLFNDNYFIKLLLRTLFGSKGEVRFSGFQQYGFIDYALFI
jgi:hypothetical protein